MQRPLLVNTVAWSMHTIGTVACPPSLHVYSTPTLLPLTATGLALASSSGLPVSQISLHNPSSNPCCTIYNSSICTYPTTICISVNQWIHLPELFIHSLNQTSQPGLIDSNKGMLIMHAKVPTHSKENPRKSIPVHFYDIDSWSLIPPLWYPVF